MERAFNWTERNDLTKALKDVKLEEVYNDEFGGYEPKQPDDVATIERAAEAITWYGYEVERLQTLIGCYRTVLKEALK